MPDLSVMLFITAEKNTNSEGGNSRSRCVTHTEQQVGGVDVI